MAFEERGDNNIVNQESVLEKSSEKELRYVIKDDIEKIDISKTRVINKKSLLLELVLSRWSYCY